MPTCPKNCPPEIKHCYYYSKCGNCIEEPNPKPFCIKGGRLEYFCSMGCRIEESLRNS